jgi:Cd2+/Zn2+-exporting ATPase
VLSVPLGFFAAVGTQSKKGVVVKGGKFIEALSKVNTVLFDKTGTLTDENFEITDIKVFDGFSKEDLLYYAAYAEKFSTHPLGEVIKNAYKDIDESKIKNFEEIKGSGTKLLVDGKAVICGSEKLLKSSGIEFDTVSGSQIYVAVDGRAVGAITLAGRLREQSKAAVEGLKALGISQIVMLTGDNETAAKAVAEKCSITEYKAELLPEQKTEYLKKLQSEGKSVAFAGDGINDTPTLAEADVGIAMGTGTAAAIETGDVVLMNSNPENIVKSVKMARHAMRVIRSNVIFAIAVKIAVLILGALGMAPMWAAVFADVGVCVICVLNSTRLLLDGRK